MNPNSATASPPTKLISHKQPATLVITSACEIAHHIRERTLSPVQVVAEHLEAVAELNPKLNAFIEVRAEQALREAGEAEAKIERDEIVGRLHGVPLSIKSSIAVAGCKHEAGSVTRAGMRATGDASLVRRLKEAGAIILGLTNAPEMLMAYETQNALYGRTNSPWDVERTPGGSSGGESAAIASGMSAGGVGSDGGGSIRVPAHFSGICGLKPTPGRISASGHYPESLGPFAAMGVVGPLARSVRDLELLFQVMAGTDLGDTSAAPVPLREINPEELCKVRIGYFEEHEDCPVTPETKAAIRKAIRVLEEQGFGTVPYVPSVLRQAREYWWTLFVRLGGELLLPIFEGREDQTSSILRYARHEPQPSKQELLDAWFGRDQLRVKLFREMAEVPVIVCPVAAMPAYRHDERQWNICGKEVDYMQAMMYAQWFNLLGNPAAVVPVGASPEGLPIGIQVVGLPYSEELILKIAATIEFACGFKPPPIHA
jgi:Asp-tRNA(Asn)/Glu-tRNA(Gln) amidotransferase A subunit family amidase